MILMCVGSNELTEAAILKEVIFAFQGISGNYICYDAAKQSFLVDTKVCDLSVVTFAHLVTLTMLIFVTATVNSHLIICPTGVDCLLLYLFDIYTLCPMKRFHFVFGHNYAKS